MPVAAAPLAPGNAEQPVTKGGPSGPSAMGFIFYMLRSQNLCHIHIQKQNQPH